MLSLKGDKIGERMDAMASIVKEVGDNREQMIQVRSSRKRTANREGMSRRATLDVSHIS